MTYSQNELDAFKREFARRKRNQFLVTLPMFVLAIGVMFFEERLAIAGGLTPGVAFGIAAVFFVVIVGFSLRNWRCPACNAYLGRGSRMVHCPTCGVQLRD